MEKISRYILVLVAIITLAATLPDLYWKAFETPFRAPFVMYSCTDNDFMIFRANKNGNVWEDTRGNKYTREEYEQKLPMMYARQLMVAGTMPDSINGVALDMHDMNRARSFFRFKPQEMKSPKPNLYPMFESESGRANLEMPDDYFRINWRIEFIDAESNSVNEEKSQMFSAALYHNGFKFPAKQVSGIPTTRKSCDEGYLLVDDQDQIFHLKMIMGEPFVAKIDNLENLRFRQINCVDFNDKAFYAYLFSENNDIYILTQDEYQLVKLPVDGFNPDSCEMKIYGDMFHYNIIIEDESHINSIVLNREFKKVDQFQESWEKRADLKEGKVSASIFPFQISMTDKNSNFVKFFIYNSTGFIWLLINALLAIVHFFVVRKTPFYNRAHIIDHFIVLATGIFGFIAVLIFPAKFFPEAGK